ncbi:MAG TPA: hypothetical protein VNX68_04720, partial [Nitrosopumilaceae archaeon]|nr:hypothetical protein [Nitrosopumilaceae archaeon]
MSKKRKEYSDEIICDLKTIIDEFEREDQSVRERQIRIWKRLQMMWSGFSRIWWSETAHDWRINEINAAAEDDSYYDKNINVFRSYLESIIAAMSATVPGVRCKPDDADNINDVLTAKGGTKIAELIYQHNDAPLLWIKALFIYCTQGMIAAWNYSEENKKYGMVGIPKYEESEETQKNAYCPSCGKQMQSAETDAAIAKELTEQDEFQPDNDDVKLHDQFNAEGNKVTCENCQQLVDPEMRDEPIIVTRIVGETQQAKSRQKIVIEGGLYIKVANYARCQEDTPYLAYCYETHYSNVYKEYPHLRKENKDIT